MLLELMLRWKCVQSCIFRVGSWGVWGAVLVGMGASAHGQTPSLGLKEFQQADTKTAFVLPEVWRVAPKQNALHQGKFGLQYSRSKALRLVALKIDKNKCNKTCQELLARTLFDAAKDFVRLGHKAQAVRYLRQIIDHLPGTSVANEAVTLALKWEKDLMNRVDHSGRVEFIVFTSLYGIGLGIMTPFVFSYSAPAFAFGISILGFTGAAVLASILGTSRLEMPEGMASMTWNSTLWGAWNFLAIGLIADIGRSRGENLILMPWLGSILGYGVGLIAGKFARPTPGMSFLAGTLGAWAAGYVGAIAGLVGINGGRVDGRGLLAGLLIASDIGFIGGFFLQKAARFSRSRLLLLNLGGAIGGGVGVGLGLIFLSALGYSSGAANFMVIAPMVLTIGGFLLTFYLTRNMAPEKKTENILNSAGSLLNLQNGRWAWGMPIPNVTPVVPLGGDVQPGIQVMVPVLSGKW